TARSTTLPRKRNCLKPLSMISPGVIRIAGHAIPTDKKGQRGTKTEAAISKKAQQENGWA
ncbi:MAG: hypothetical protein ACM3JB_02825, partial [Acidobacteriaceae bacterium]